MLILLAGRGQRDDDQPDRQRRARAARASRRARRAAQRSVAACRARSTRCSATPSPGADGPAHRDARRRDPGQRPIPAGEFVLCWLGSANRDEAVFDAARVVRRPPREATAPARSASDRTTASARRSRRSEPSLPMRVLLERTRDFRRTDDAPLPFHPSIVFRGVTKLPMVLEAGVNDVASLARAWRMAGRAIVVAHRRRAVDRVGHPGLPLAGRTLVALPAR